MEECSLSVGREMKLGEVPLKPITDSPKTDYRFLRLNQKTRDSLACLSSCLRPPRSPLRGGVWGAFSVSLSKIPPSKVLNTDFSGGIYRCQF